MTGVYDSSYWEGGFLDHGHLLVGIVASVTVTTGGLVGVSLGGFVGVAFETSSSCAVAFSGSEYGLPLESVSWARTCVGWLTVADVRPGPLT